MKIEEMKVKKISLSKNEITHLCFVAHILWRAYGAEANILGSNDSFKDYLTPDDVVKAKKVVDFLIDNTIIEDGAPTQKEIEDWGIIRKLGLEELYIKGDKVTSEEKK